MRIAGDHCRKSKPVGQGGFCFSGDRTVEAWHMFADTAERKDLNAMEGPIKLIKEDQTQLSNPDAAMLDGQ